MIAIQSVWNNTKKINIHDIKDLFPCYHLHMLLAQMEIHHGVVGKSYLQRPIKANHPCIRKNGICDIFTNTMMQTLTRMDKEVIEDYYHMTPIDTFKLDETNKSIVNFFLKP